MTCWRVAVGVFLVIGLSMPVAAESPKWTYAEFGYTKFDSSENGATGNDTEQANFNFLGSVGFSGLGHAMLEYRNGEVEEFDGAGGSDVDFDGFEVYLGAHPELNDTTDLVFDFFYFDETYEDFDGTNDQNCDGYGMRAGLRSLALNDKLELMAFGRWTDGNCELGGGAPDENFTDTSAELGGQYIWRAGLSTGIVYVANDSRAVDGDDSLRFFVRFSFEEDIF